VDAGRADQAEPLPALLIGLAGPALEPLAQRPAVGRAAGAGLERLDQLERQPGGPAAVDQVAHPAMQSTRRRNGHVARLLMRAAHTSSDSSTRVCGRSKSRPCRVESTARRSYRRWRAMPSRLAADAFDQPVATSASITARPGSSNRDCM